MSILGGVLVLVGLVWAAAFWMMHNRAVGKAKAAESWPIAAGRITGSEVVTEESEDSEGGTTTWHRPHISYSYSVGGAELIGTRLRFGNVRTRTREKAEAVLGPYPPGAEIQARYNPKDPSDCVLEATKPGPLYLVMSLFGLLFVALGLFALLAG